MSTGRNVLRAALLSYSILTTLLQLYALSKKFIIGPAEVVGIQTVKIPTDNVIIIMHTVTVLLVLIIFSPMFQYIIYIIIYLNFVEQLLLFLSNVSNIYELLNIKIFPYNIKYKKMMQDPLY